MGNQHKLLKTGDSYIVDTGVNHKFYNSGDKLIKFQVELRPGHEGFEKCIQISYNLAKDGRTRKNGIPKRISHLAILLSLSDTNLPGIYKALSFVMNWLASRAQKKGIEKELVMEYCN